MSGWTVTAHMAEPIVNWRPEMMLDGPLSWGAFRLRQGRNHGPNLPPMTPDHAHDFDLPLARWTVPAFGDHHPELLDDRGNIWGWCTSAVITEDAAALSGVDVRRRPATDPMSRWSDAKRHHIGLGPMKARNVRLPAAFAHRLAWHIDSEEPDAVMRLLEHVTHLGRMTRHGHGRILHWEIRAHQSGAWMERPMPHKGGQPMSVRAPHHHPTRQAPCSW